MSRAEIEAYNYGAALATHGVALPETFPATLPEHPEVDRGPAARALMRLGTAKFNYWVRVGIHETARAG